MIIGARQGYQGPWIRQPGKKLLNSIASYLVDFKIPDLNSGLRLIKKDLFFRFSHLYPNNFSLTTTITLAFIKEALNVKYIPIKIEKRLGTSTVKPRDALQTFILITRIITLFSPMRFFLPISLFLLILTSVSLIYDFTERNISDASVILFLGSVLTFFFGTILDQISALRRHNK